MLSTLQPIPNSLHIPNLFNPANMCVAFLLCMLPIVMVYELLFLRRSDFAYINICEYEVYIESQFTPNRR